jgi:signal-transduction protein with cAMP-binding, CBS, and nucleotidyltransferase domain
MMVRDGMNPIVVTVGSAHSLREAARRMTRANVGAAVVVDPDLPAPAIITERDILHCIGQDGDLDAERVGDHLTARPVFAGPDWPLERAAEEMTAGGFRHVIVIEGPHVQGILSMRDIVRVWIGAGAAGPIAALSTPT